MTIMISFVTWQGIFFRAGSICKHGLNAKREGMERDPLKQLVELGKSQNKELEVRIGKFLSFIGLRATYSGI